MRKHFAKADRKITFDITITDGYSSVSGTGALCLSSNFQALFRSPREAHAKHPHLRLKPHLSFFHLLRLRHGILLWLRKSPPRKQFANKAKSKVFREAVRGHILTWYLAYILTFYLAFYLTYILTFYPEASSLDYASRVRLNHALDCALNHPLDLLALLI